MVATLEQEHERGISRQARTAGRRGASVGVASRAGNRRVASRLAKRRSSSTTSANVRPTRVHRRHISLARPLLANPARGASGSPSMLNPWLDAQAINLVRHVGALRPFKREEFGTGAEAPTEGHVQAVNTLINSLRADLIRWTQRLTRQVAVSRKQPTSDNLRALVDIKERSHLWVQAIEKVWDFYLELFSQRQTRFGLWLLACDRVALDCYQVAYTHLGVARSVPAPPPMSYLRTGFSPATFRRSIPLKRLGHQMNPFPLIQLPYHRLVNPWTLGAMLHEVSHNLQNELGLAEDVPRAIARRLLAAGHSKFVTSTWVRWNRETFSDMSGLLLGGPGIVPSLMDVVGRSHQSTLNYLPRGPHPTPYLRTFLSTELLKRMGFGEESEQYARAWKKIYSNPHEGNIPKPLLDTYEDVIPLVVDTICYKPYHSLGNKTLAQVLPFAAKEQAMVEEAARRMSKGIDPGIVPERFMIGAARFAVDNRLAPPERITRNFYTELARR